MTIVWYKNPSAQYLGFLLLLQKKEKQTGEELWFGRPEMPLINGRCSFSLFFLDIPENYIQRIIILLSLKCEFQTHHTYEDNDGLWTK